MPTARFVFSALGCARHGVDDRVHDAGMTDHQDATAIVRAPADPLQSAASTRATSASHDSPPSGV